MVDQFTSQLDRESRILIRCHVCCICVQVDFEWRANRTSRCFIINRKMHVIRFETADVLVQMTIQTHNHSLAAAADATCSFRMAAPTTAAAEKIAHHKKNNNFNLIYKPLAFSVYLLVSGSYCIKGILSNNFVIC